jgi:NADPH:quinone reductase-like Zn-dependent oxidoreductase
MRALESARLEVLCTLRQIYRLPVPLPALSIGHDLSGTVVAAGRHVYRLKVGDEVFAMSMKPGAFGQYLP